MSKSFEITFGALTLTASLFGLGYSSASIYYWNEYYWSPKDNSQKEVSLSMLIVSCIMLVFLFFITCLAIAFLVKVSRENRLYTGQTGASLSIGDYAASQVSQAPQAPQAPQLQQAFADAQRSTSLPIPQGLQYSSIGVRGVEMSRLSSSVENPTMFE